MIKQLTNSEIGVVHGGAGFLKIISAVAEIVCLGHDGIDILQDVISDTSHDEDTQSWTSLGFRAIELACAGILLAGAVAQVVMLVTRCRGHQKPE